MQKVGLFYGSQWGNTQRVAYQAQQTLGEHACDVFDVADQPLDALGDYEWLIFGVSTIDAHDMQDHWRDFLPTINGHLAKRPVALFGLGDQVGFPNDFVNGLGLLYDEVARRQARVVGSWSDDGYTYEASRAYRQGRFVGLPLDEENQPAQTSQRLETWLAQVMLEFARL